ncbi:DUF7524 family protein [Haloglomus halophilum]|uniref:DUF7524 family protein n=1 Tax=Haloglomus halophilum TaxID=2962672 RepID=UPI0020C9414E|nr:hypothetical protein [Haloglomus halophilum]
MTDATDRLVVDINQDGARSLAAPASVTVDRSFTVDLRNHGMATHVHLHLDDALSTVARLSNANLYVSSEDSRRVQVNVFEPEDGEYEPVTGRLKIAIAYGQETRFVDLTIDLSSHEPVNVDPDLATPNGGGDGAERTAARPDGTATGTATDVSGTAGGSSPLARSRTVKLLPAVLLGLVAVGLAAAAVVPAGTPNLSLGGLAVAAAVLAAAYLLLT